MTYKTHPCPYDEAHDPSTPGLHLTRSQEDSLWIIGWCLRLAVLSVLGSYVAAFVRACG